MIPLALLSISNLFFDKERKGVVDTADDYGPDIVGYGAVAASYPTLAKFNVRAGS